VVRQTVEKWITARAERIEDEQRLEATFLAGVDADIKAAWTAYEKSDTRARARLAQLRGISAKVRRLTGSPQKHRRA